MRIKDFFEHHRIVGNPFAEEDAQTDLVFKSHCIKNTFHPAWDKLFGSPEEASTSIVFGEKGAGKTALRLQMVRALAEYNTDHPDARPFVIEYDDFNPFLDAFKARFPRRRSPERVLDQFKVWDHLDAILSLGTTQLVDRILYPSEVSYPAAVDTRSMPLEKLSHHQKRDLLALLVCYDHSRSEEPRIRWRRLAEKLSFRDWKGWLSVQREFLIGLLGSILVLLFFILCFRNDWLPSLSWKAWFLIPLALAFPWVFSAWKALYRWWSAFRLGRSIHVLKPKKGDVRKILMQFPTDDFISLPLPSCRESDNRYELLARFQKILSSLGFSGLIVLVDRVDEPYLINGSTELMKRLIWPMLDNKLLQHPGMGFKLLLLDSLLRRIERESKEFHERSRIDKQNLVRNLDWTGEALLDLTNARLQACKNGEENPTIEQFFDESITRRQLIDAFGKLKVPRHLFKFLYRLLTQHIAAHTDAEPVWTISPTLFATELALYLKEREAAERQLGVV